MNEPNRELHRWMAAVGMAVRRRIAAWPIGARFECPLCGRRVRRFLPYRLAHSGLPAVLQEADVVGSDIENFECPACGCHDRERHLALYLAASGLERRIGGARVLHFAPERHLSRLIRSKQPTEYVMADLFPTSREIRRVDMTAMDLPDRHFDFVIANHVLEHVSDDRRALAEIRRVLKPGGWAILQTPFAAGRPGRHEDSSIVEQSARLASYGQEDHVRLYGADLTAFIVGCGLSDCTGSHARLLPHVDARSVGVNVREPFLLFRKPIESEPAA